MPQNALAAGLSAAPDRGNSSLQRFPDPSLAGFQEAQWRQPFFATEKRKGKEEVWKIWGERKEGEGSG